MNKINLYNITRFFALIGVISLFGWIWNSYFTYIPFFKILLTCIIAGTLTYNLDKAIEEESNK